MTADHGPYAASAYASTTACGAGAKTWPRTACQAAAALNVMDRANDTRTPATTHCHTHRATTGSRSGHLARAMTRGVARAVSAPSRSSARETSMATPYERRTRPGYGLDGQVTQTTVERGFCPTFRLTG